MNRSHARRAVFLDRDGVLIRPIVRDRKPYAASRPDEVRIIEGVPEACAELSRLGFLLVMVTNQPDIARGKVSREFVERTNAELAHTLGLDDVQLCPHDDADECACRKPKPGLMTRAADSLRIDLGASIVVGDRWRDIEAGRRAGCRTVFIDCGYDEVLKETPDRIAASLSDAVEWIRGQL